MYTLKELCFTNENIYHDLKSYQNNERDISSVSILSASRFMLFLKITIK